MHSTPEEKFKVETEIMQKALTSGALQCASPHSAGWKWNSLCKAATFVLVTFKIQSFIATCTENRTDIGTDILFFILTAVTQHVITQMYYISWNVPEIGTQAKVPHGKISTLIYAKQRS